MSNASTKVINPHRGFHPQSRPPAPTKTSQCHAQSILPYHVGLHGKRLCLEQSNKTFMGPSIPHLATSMPKASHKGETWPELAQAYGAFSTRRACYVTSSCQPCTSPLPKYASSAHETFSNIHVDS